MSTSWIVAFGLMVVGGVAGIPALILLGLLTGATVALSSLWSHRGLSGVRYERRLATDRAVWGDQVELDVIVQNGKLLPLAWLQADDFASAGVELAERRLPLSDRPGLSVLRNLWTLAPFEQVRRRFHVDAEQRGRFAFEAVRLSVADVFGRAVADREERQEAVLLVRPRTVPVRSARGAVVPLGARRAAHGLVEDPSFFAGVRPFQPGDLRRRIHQRASARVGRPVSKRYEPSTARQVVVAVDIQTHDGPFWLLTFDESVVESLAVAAASLARRMLADGAACGVAINGHTRSLALIGFVPPRAGVGHLTRIADLLARTSSIPRVPFERLLAGLPSRLAAGTLVLSLSSRDPANFIPALRRLRGSGFEVVHVALGQDAPSHTAHLRRAGVDAVLGRLEPDWRTSDALTLAG